AFVLERAAVSALERALPAFDPLVEARHHAEARVQRQVPPDLARLLADAGALEQERRAICPRREHDAASADEEARQELRSVSADAARHTRGAGPLRHDPLDVEVGKNPGARGDRAAQIRAVDAELRVLGATEVTAPAAVASARIAAHRGEGMAEAFRA